MQKKGDNMFYLKSGDMNNERHIDILSNNSILLEEILSDIEHNNINYEEKLENIFTKDDMEKGEYELICCILTVGDLIPVEKQLDYFTATAYYFCLQVNFLNKFHDSDKKVASPYLAVKTAQAWHWDYAEYLNAEETVNDQLSSETMIQPIHFSYILNELTFYVPVVAVKKGFLRKKTIGYMLSPDLNSYGAFTVGTHQNKYKLPKSALMELMEQNIHSNKSYIFEDKANMFILIDRHSTASTMLEVLYINGFFGMCSFTTEDGNVWVDDQDDLLYVENKTAPSYNEGEENVPATWEKVREHLFRAITHNRKLYISYLYNNNIALLST